MRILGLCFALLAINTSAIEVEGTSVHNLHLSGETQDQKPFSLSLDTEKTDNGQTLKHLELMIAKQVFKVPSEIIHKINQPILEAIALDFNDGNYMLSLPHGTQEPCKLTFRGGVKRKVTTLAFNSEGQLISSDEDYKCVPIYKK